MDELIRINYDSERPTVNDATCTMHLASTPSMQTGFRECVNTDFRKDRTVLSIPRFGEVLFSASHLVNTHKSLSIDKTLSKQVY